KTGFAAVGKRTYGLSPEHNGKRVQAKIYFDRIQFFYENLPLKTYGPAAMARMIRHLTGSNI
ncbi:MAG: hypothetical protein LBU32_21750, partial [Clostridiales bacterium]|nr:hypothetical protein [Clostridiales bacterium]